MTIDLVPVSTTPKPTTSEVCFASPALNSNPKLALRQFGCLRDPGSNMRRHSVSTPIRMAHLSHLREESTVQTATCRNNLRKFVDKEYCIINANVLLAGAYIWNMT